MKRLFIMLSTIVCALDMSAQTYLEHLQTKETGKGQVVVVESPEIDRLVNGNAPKDANAKKQTATQEKTEKAETAHKTTPQKSAHEESGNTDITSVSTNRHVAKNTYKVTGYRVQVFAGGNSRTDKSKAETTGSQIKALFPEQPVYVHFYSPRWICRMGNFRTYAEAEEMLKKVREAGYKQASLVKGKITVEY